MALMLGLSDAIDSTNDLVEMVDTSNVSLVECGRDNVRSATDIANAVSQLEFGTHLAVRFRETLSRFSAGVLYLLAGLFKTVTVTFSDVPGTWPLWTFLDVDVDCADALLEYFATITAVEVGDTSTVLEVVPLAHAVRHQIQQVFEVHQRQHTTRVRDGRSRYCRRFPNPPVTS
ncbi:hypothetical protein MTO96_020462 [Rhipicephalus appendiculatus]